MNLGVQQHQISIIVPLQSTGSIHTKESKRIDLDVETTTINAFQGREQDVVICSFVRSNLKGVLGFVQDERRLTVALTRASICSSVSEIRQHWHLILDLLPLFELLDQELHSMWLGLED